MGLVTFDVYGIDRTLEEGSKFDSVISSFVAGIQVQYAPASSGGLKLAVRHRGVPDDDRRAYMRRWFA